MRSTNRQDVLAQAEKLQFDIEDLIGTIRSIRNNAEFLTISERQWLEYLEDSTNVWMTRLSRIDMFQPTLWDGH
jgi:hypothetical protein